MSLAWGAAASAVESRAPGSARGRPCGRTYPAASAGIADGESRPLRCPAATLYQIHGTMPGMTSAGRCPARARNGSWNGAAAIPAPPVLSVRFPVSSVQPVGSVHGPVVMVRRRSTVRFRNGAPGHGQFFERIERAAWNESWRRSSAAVAAEAPIAKPEPGRQLWKVAAGGPSRNSRVTVRARSRWAGRPAAGRSRATAARIPAHAVRVRDVLQLDGLRALPRALPTSSRNECIEGV